MKKIKVQVEVEKKGLLGPKKVTETKTIMVDNKTYKEIMKRDKNRPFTVEELELYDEIFDEWD